MSTAEHTTFSRDDHGNVTITNPYDDCRFQLMQLRSALGIEIRTGLRNSRGSVLAFLATHSVDSEGGQPISSKRTKVGAYEDLDRVCVEQGLDPKPLPASVKGSLAHKASVKALAAHERHLARERAKEAARNPFSGAAFLASIPKV
jgi:hypothetical protein